MKIAILLDRIMPGGVSPFVFEEVKWLTRAGYDVELLLIARCPQYEFTSMERVKCLSDKFPLFFRHSFKFPFFDYFSSFHILSPFVTPHVLSEKFGIVVSHLTYTCFTAIQLWKRKKIPYIAYIHDPISYILRKSYSMSSFRYIIPILLPVGLYLDTQIVRNAIVTVTQSKFHEEFLKNISNKEVKVVYPGCYPDREIPKKRGNYLLATKANWTCATNAHFLIEILDKLDKEISLVITGRWSPDYLEFFLKKAQTHGVRNNVIVRGLVGMEELIKLYRGARALVQTSLEAFGMNCLEAASHGCPFIIPEGSGVTSIFRHNVHGFFPAEQDVDAYVRYVDKLTSNGCRAWRMGHDAWKTSGQYSWEAHTKCLAEIIENAVK